MCYTMRRCNRFSLFYSNVITKNGSGMRRERSTHMERLPLSAHPTIRGRRESHCRFGPTKRRISSPGSFRRRPDISSGGWARSDGWVWTLGSCSGHCCALLDNLCDLHFTYDYCATKKYKFLVIPISHSMSLVSVSSFRSSAKVCSLCKKVSSSKKWSSQEYLRYCHGNEIVSFIPWK